MIAYLSLFLSSTSPTFLVPQSAPRLVSSLYNQSTKSSRSETKQVSLKKVGVTLSAAFHLCPRALSLPPSFVSCCISSQSPYSLEYCASLPTLFNYNHVNAG